MRHSHIELIFYPVLFKWFQTSCLQFFTFWAIADGFGKWRSNSTIFNNLSILNNWFYKVWWVFDIKITATESTKQELRDWRLQYQYHKHYSQFQSPGVGFIEEKLKNIVFSLWHLIWSPSLTRVQTILS